MIISHRLKFAFFRIPKTGSTTMEMILRMSGLFDADDLMPPLARYGLPGGTAFPPDSEKPNVWASIHHMTPQAAVDNGYITEAQIQEYTVRCALRDPLERAVSSFAHSMTSIPLKNPKVFKQMVIERRDLGILEKPQIDYFYVNGNLIATPVDFSNFQQSVTDMVNEVGAKPEAGKYTLPMVMPNFNVSVGKDKTDNRSTFIDIDPEVDFRIREKHAADITLYESFYGTV